MIFVTDNRFFEGKNHKNDLKNVGGFKFWVSGGRKLHLFSDPDPPVITKTCHPPLLAGDDSFSGGGVYRGWHWVVSGGGGPPRRARSSPPPTKVGPTNPVGGEPGPLQKRYLSFHAFFPKVRCSETNALLQKCPKSLFGSFGGGQKISAWRKASGRTSVSLATPHFRWGGIPHPFDLRGVWTSPPPAFH